MIVGCFEVTKVSTGRWRVVNTLTEFVHVTYGSEEEIRGELTKQSDAWEKRVAESEAKKAGKRTQAAPPTNRTLAPLKKNPQMNPRGQ